MKKVIITVFLVLILTMTSFSANFIDVPTDHWAYEAVNKLVSEGAITGYPDETFKGQNNLSRYEIAVIISRILNEIEKERALIIKKTKDDSLSIDEKIEVNEIIKSIVTKNTGKNLSEEEADEACKIVRALTSEFSSELKEIGVTVDNLVIEVEELKKEVEDLKEKPQDRVNFSGTINTIYEYADYGNSTSKNALIGENELYPGVYTYSGILDDYKTKLNREDFISESALYQEINLKMNTNINDINFNFVLGGLINTLTKTTGNYGTTSDIKDLKLDEATLRFSKGAYDISLGSLSMFMKEDYFINYYNNKIPSMEGISINGSVADANLSAFVVGKKDDNDSKYYGLKISKNIGKTNFAGKFYQVTDYTDNVDRGGQAMGDVKNFALSASSNITDKVKLNGEYVFNTAEELDEDAHFINIGAEVSLSDDLTVRGSLADTDKEFVKVDTWRLNGYQGNTIYEVEGDYKVNKNNIVKGTLTVAVPEVNDLVNENEIIVSLDNFIGSFSNTASVELTQNDGNKENNDVTKLILETNYTMNDKNTITAKLTNKRFSYKDNNKNKSYLYLIGGLKHKLSNNMKWNTEAHIISGSGDWEEAMGNMLKTELVYSF